MRRRSVRPFGQSTTSMRLVSMVMALVVLWALYRQVKDPTLWRIVFDRPDSSPQAVAKPIAETEPEPEPIVADAEEQDEDDATTIEKMLEMVTDRTPLKTREMSAYWKLLAWSRSEPFSDLRRKAKADVPFTQLWEQPEKYRGQSIRMRLHVRRVLEYDAPENPLRVKKSYEAWGWTDESRSFPYVVVFTDPPGDLPIGTDVRAEIEFVGYFLKIMTYTAYDNARGAPLLVGTARLVSVPTPVSTPAKTDWISIAVVLGACLAIIAYVVISNRRTRNEVRQTKSLPNDWTAPNTEEESANGTDDGSEETAFHVSSDAATGGVDSPHSTS